MSQADKDIYKANKIARNKLHREERNKKYRRLSEQASETGCSFSGVRWGSWADSSSPTGYSQRCEMGGKCQFPCNGDC